MKKIFPLIVTAMFAVSCFNDVGYEASYTLYSTYDGTEQVFTDLAQGSAAADSAAAVSGFSFGPIAYYNTVSQEGSMPPKLSDGGWIISTSNYPIDILLSHVNSGNSGDGGDGSDTGDGGTVSPSVDWQSKLTDYCVSDTTDAAGGSNGVFLVYNGNGATPEHDMEFLQSTIGTCTVSSCAINTTAKVAKYFKTEAVQGDYFKVIVTGHLNGNSTGRVEYCLADYRSGNLDSLKTEWKTLNLSKLGNVQYVDFDIESVMTNASEALKYFCMDNFIASIHVKQ